MATEQEESLYICNICSKGYQLKSMYACYHGHYLCKKCYKQMYYRAKNKRCPHGMCNAAFVGDESKIAPMERSRMMFPNPGVYSQYNNVNNNNSIVSLASIYRPSLSSLGMSSKRPVHCPHNGCNKTIAVSSLDSHFEHEHKHVAAVTTTLDTRNGLEFFFNDLHGKVRTLCLVLINLDEKNDGANNYLSPEDNLSPQRSYYSKCSLTIPKPFFIVMAAKVTANDYNGIEEDDEEELPDTGFSPIDRIIFYVASNIITNYTYTIAASTPDQGIRIKYYGPLLTMNESYKKLCDEGKGLILNHNHVDGMSDYGTKNVCIDVIIHERDEDTYDSD